MDNQSRKILPSQFGLFELFALTTVAALAFAIFRLPIDRSIRTLLLMALWVAFQIFVANTTSQGPTRQVRMAVMGGAASLIQIVPPCLDLFFHRGKLPVWIDISFALFFLFMVVLQAALVTWQVRTALRAEAEKA